MPAVTTVTGSRASIGAKTGASGSVVKPNQQTATGKERYYTPSEVALHNSEQDCWVSLLGKVLNLTNLLAQNTGNELCRPILINAGTDISHWFDPNTGQIKTHIDPLTNCESPYVPHGRFLHVPPNMPRADWSNMIEIPWWMDDQNYQVGKLTKRVRKLRIVNTLTKEEHLLEACTEETLTQIQERYSKAFNCHAKGYMWKRLGVLLDMNSTLDGNHIVDEADKFEMAGMDEDEHLIIIHLYFSDDLTVA